VIKPQAILADIEVRNRDIAEARIECERVIACTSRERVVWGSNQYACNSNGTLGIHIRGHGIGEEGIGSEPLPDDLSVSIDAGSTKTAAWGINRHVLAVVVDKPVVVSGIVHINSDDLSFVIDARRMCKRCSGKIDNGISAAVVQETLFSAAGTLREIPDKFSLAINARDNCTRAAAWRVDCRVGPVVVQEAAVIVKPGDLPLLVDAYHVGVGGPGRIDNGVLAAAIEEAVGVATAVEVIPGDLSRGVDAPHKRFGAAWRINRRIDAAAIEEAVLLATAVEVIPGDLSLIINAGGNGPSTIWGSIVV